MTVVLLIALAVIAIGVVVAAAALIVAVRTPRREPAHDLRRAGDEPAPAAQRNHGGTTGLNF